MGSILTIQSGAAAAGLMPFHFDGRQIRVVTDENGEPLFVGKDVCEALGYANAADALKSHCRGVARRYPIADALGRTQETRVLAEPDVLRLIVNCSLPAAEPFERLVFEEILPTIRRTGSYSVAAAPALPRSFAEALRLAADQQETIEAQAQQLEAAKPAVEFVERYADATGTKGFREVAKILQANESQFREFLIEERVMYRLAGALTPYGQHIDAGRFCVKTGTAQANGHAYSAARFTPKGVTWIAGEWAKWQLKQRGEGAHV
jgi:prophage antirepressor-like protein